MGSISEALVENNIYNYLLRVRTGVVRFLLLKLGALLEVVVELPVFLIPNVAYRDHVQLARPGKVETIKGIGLRATVMPEVDGGGSGDLHVLHPLVAQVKLVCQPLLATSAVAVGEASVTTGEAVGTDFTNVSPGLHSLRK